MIVHPDELEILTCTDLYTVSCITEIATPALPGDLYMNQEIFEVGYFPALIASITILLNAPDL